MRLRSASRTLCLVALALFVVAPVAVHAQGTNIVLTPGAAKKLDPLLKKQLKADRKSRVIVRAHPGQSPDAAIAKEGGPLGRQLSIINGRVTELNHQRIAKLADDPGVAQIDLDRPAHAANERTGAAVGTTQARAELGYDGAGVGVAVVDSGAFQYHDDLKPNSTWAGNRVVAFRDFVGTKEYAYDDYGHGTHVAGIIAGNGYSSSGKRIGIAPGSHLVVLKVLDDQGRGVISDIIAAIDYAVQNRAAYNIRVINLSISSGVYQSFTTDPLTVACRRAAESGVVVVAAAGNFGRAADGTALYRRVTAPANAPWVLAVGASSHMGSTGRADDTIARFSSRGPTHIDRLAKPDIVAPGIGIESLLSPNGTMYTSKSAFRLTGTLKSNSYPYLSLSGTSMATPVVSGTIALMLQANPNLTPNAVKAILQYTAEVRTGLNLLTQGGGFLNGRGAVRLAKYFANPAAGLPGGTADVYPDGLSIAWSRHITWGNHRIGPGKLRPGRNAWNVDVLWGAAKTPTGTFVTWGSSCSATDPACENVVWGSDCTEGDANCDNVVWGSSCPVTDPACDNVVWGSTDDDNVVWGSSCPADDPACDNVVWGSSCPETDPNCDNVVWGSTDGENVVWGSECPADNPDCDNVVWGSTCPETDPNCDNVVWGSADGDNVIWGFDWRRRRDLVEDSYVAFRQVLAAVKGVL